jgi:hypothetical protein
MQNSCDHGEWFPRPGGEGIMTTARRSILNYALLVLAGIVIAAYSYLVYDYTKMQMNDNLRLNIAARQRMLTQKIAKGIILYRDGIAMSGQVREDIELFEISLHAITYGGTVFENLDRTSHRNLTAMDDSACREILEATFREWQQFRGHALRYLETREPVSFQYILDENENLLFDFDKSATAIQEHADSDMMVLLILIICAIAAITASVVAVFIIQIRRIRLASRRLKEIERLLPLCSRCKKIRTANGAPDDPGSWMSIDDYLKDHRGMIFTHSLCPDCIAELYPDIQDIGR